MSGYISWEPKVPLPRPPPKKWFDLLFVEENHCKIQYWLGLSYEHRHDVVDANCAATSPSHHSVEPREKKLNYPLVNWHSNGISPFLIGNTSSKGPCSIAMLDCRSVSDPMMIPESLMEDSHRWLWSFIFAKPRVVVHPLRNDPFLTRHFLVTARFEKDTCEHQDASVDQSSLRTDTQNHRWLTPPKMDACPLKREPFEKDISSSNHQFSGDMLVFRGVEVIMNNDSPNPQNCPGNCLQDFGRSQIWNLEFQITHPNKVLYLQKLIIVPENRPS